MSFKEYIKGKLPVLFVNISVFAFVTLLFFVYDINERLIYLILSIWFLPIITFIWSDFFKKKKYYNTVLSELELLDQKYLITEIIKKPTFPEGTILYDILKDATKCMHENINNYKHLDYEYREYIETWVHEIKTPIASSKLVIENNKTDVTISIMEELIKIEDFVEQVLYYSRSNNTEEDYIVREFSLKNVVNEVIKRNMKCFIQKKIHLAIDDIDINIFSDTKWVKFILNQIIVNSINYSKSETPIIKIYSKKNDNNATLYIEDNGIGINEKDLSLVFNKSFTGINGRIYEKSTGMGLYLCKKLCTKLNLEIGINSAVNLGTTVKITFPINKMMVLE
jgi:signal transduction histidine kinase